MFTLTFTEPSGKRQSHPVVDEARGITVGRDPGCDVVLASKEVSRRHCRFFVQAGDLMVEDLGSHNGVIVGGQRIAGRRPLLNAEPVELGDVHVQIGATAPAPQPPVKPRNPTSTLPPGSVMRNVAPRVPARPPARKPTPSRPAMPKAPKPAPARGAAGVGAGAVLRGLGPHAAVQIQLPASAVIGRGDDCDIVLDDGSVSRRHALLSRDERGRYRIEDLGSANGTYVDTSRVVKPTVLPDGSRLRFGDVELLFWRPPTGSGLTARHRMLIAVGLALAAMFAALYFLKQRRAEREVAQADDPGAAGDQATQLAEQAKAALSSDRFEEAARLAQQAVDADPIASAPRKILAQARREQIAQKLFADASTKGQVGREEEALQMFARLDPQSRFFPRARIKAKELAQNLLRTHSTACKLAASRAKLQAVVDVCARALDVKCQMQDVEGDPMRRSLRQATLRLGRRDTWTCPADLGPLFREEADASEQGGEATLVGDRALRARYPDGAVFEAVSQYSRGETANALRSLTGGPAARGKSAQTARDVAEKIRMVDGRFREGQTAVLRGELARADELWAEALRADAELMPPGAASFLGQQMRNMLGQAHAKVGDEKLSKAQYASAYDEYVRGLALLPADAHLLDSLARLEKIAEGLLANGACDQVQVALRITRADPPSPAHAQAQKALESCGRQ